MILKDRHGNPLPTFIWREQRSPLNGALSCLRSDWFRSRVLSRRERRRRSQVIALSRSSEVVFGHLAVAQNLVEQARADRLA